MLSAEVDKSLDILRKRLDQPLDKKGRAFYVGSRLSSRRFVISDIHACYSTFLKMLRKIDFKKTDQLFIIGDMIDRGPYSVLVLQKIIQMINEGFEVYPLRGNHEQIYLTLQKKATADLYIFAKRQNAGQMLNRKYLLHPDLSEFLGFLPYYYETDDHFLVHAGFNTELNDPFSDWQNMIWTRRFRYDKKKMKGKRVVHGHVPTSLEQIKNRVKSGDKIICLDNGCVRAKAFGYGELICYELSSNSLYTQKNIDLIRT